MGDEDGLEVAAAMDTTISEIPGLDDTHLISDSARDAIRRIGPVASENPRVELSQIIQRVS